MHSQSSNRKGERFSHSQKTVNLQSPYQTYCIADDQVLYPCGGLNDTNSPQVIYVTPTPQTHSNIGNLLSRIVIGSFIFACSWVLSLKFLSKVFPKKYSEIKFKEAFVEGAVFSAGVECARGMFHTLKAIF